MQTLEEFLHAHDFNIKPILNGKVMRFDRRSPLSGWLTGREQIIEGNIIQVARCGDWVTGEKYFYKTKGEFSEQINQEIEKNLKEAEEKERIEREALHEKTASECQKIWDECGRDGRSIYLERKKVPELLGARVGQSGGQPCLYVPARDVTGKVWGLQRIFDDGEKRFVPGMRLKGSFFTIGELKDGHPILVAEGFSTSASLHLATGHPVVGAFAAFNLEGVSHGLHERYPHSRLCVCGDDDRWKPETGNTGRTKAEAAAKAVAGVAVFPRFTNLDSRPTDFNDLHCLEGLEVVKRQVELALQPGAGEPDLKSGGDESSLEPGAIVPEKPKKPKVTEKQIAGWLMDHFGKNIIRQDKSLFQYDGKRWREVTLAQEDQIKNRINSMCGDKLEHKHVTSAYRTFFRYVPPVPEGVNLFNPNPFCVNFLNGTLHLRQSRDHTYQLDWQPHRREDFVINVLPHEYRSGYIPVNTAFRDMLERIFQGDTDAPEKIRTVRQMFGACLVSAFPHLFMLHGPPQTGKSTTIRIAEHMVSPENLCSVEPQEFHGFHMESMVGKLVNCDPDINTQEPITDSQIKKIIDRRMFRIRRKGIADAYGFIPAIHIFGGNNIPPTLEGASRAHDRRWSFVEFKNVQGVGNYDKEYWLWVWEQDPGAVVSFAIEGLKDLCECRGHYLNPASGKEKMLEWQNEKDPVALFIRDIEAREVGTDEVGIRLDPEAKSTRPNVYKWFVFWAKESGFRVPPLSKQEFFLGAKGKGFREVKIMGTFYLYGFDAKHTPPEAKF